MARLPEGALMQRAAAGLAVAVVDFLGSAYGRRVLLLVGSGDNGGDALWAGAMLARRGVQVEAWLLSDKAHAEGRAALERAGGRVVTEPTRRPEVVVDGIVGIGGRGGLRENAANALKLLHGVPVVAVDTPSGVDVDTGEVEGDHVEAALTVTFGTHKVCHLVDPAAAGLRCGAPRRHRARAARTGARGAPARGRRGAAAAADAGRAEVRARRGRRPRRQRAVPRRRAAQRRGRGVRAGRDGPVRRRRGGRGQVKRSIPRWSARAGSRPGWSAPAAATRRRRQLAAALGGRRPGGRRRGRAPARRAGPGSGADATRRRARGDARRGPAGHRGQAAALRPRGGEEVRRHGPAQGPPHGRSPGPTAGPGSTPPAPPGSPRRARATCSAA